MILHILYSVEFAVDFCVIYSDRCCFFIIYQSCVNLGI